jgi:hypothetical protein
VGVQCSVNVRSVQGTKLWLLTCVCLGTIVTELLKKRTCSAVHLLCKNWRIVLKIDTVIWRQEFWVVSGNGFRRCETHWSWRPPLWDIAVSDGRLHCRSLKTKVVPVTSNWYSYLKTRILGSVRKWVQKVWDPLKLEASTVRHRCEWWKVTL